MKHRSEQQRDPAFRTKGKKTTTQNCSSEPVQINKHDVIEMPSKWQEALSGTEENILTFPITKFSLAVSSDEFVQTSTHV